MQAAEVAEQSALHAPVAQFAPATAQLVARLASSSIGLVVVPRAEQVQGTRHCSARSPASVGQASARCSASNASCICAAADIGSASASSRRASVRGRLPAAPVQSLLPDAALPPRRRPSGYRRCRRPTRPAPVGGARSTFRHTRPASSTALRSGPRSLTTPQALTSAPTASGRASADARRHATIRLSRSAPSSVRVTSVSRLKSGASGGLRGLHRAWAAAGEAPFAAQLLRRILLRGGEQPELAVASWRNSDFCTSDCTTSTVHGASSTDRQVDHASAAARSKPPSNTESCANAAFSGPRAGSRTSRTRAQVACRPPRARPIPAGGNARSCG